MTRTRRAGTVAVLLVTSVALSACGAGRVTQTATQDRDRTGGHGQLGDITIRAVQLAYPADGVHDPGDPVEFTMAIVNCGRVADELIGVTGDPFTGATVSAAGTSAGADETPADCPEAPPPEQSAVSIPAGRRDRARGRAGRPRPPHRTDRAAGISPLRAAAARLRSGGRAHRPRDHRARAGSPAQSRFRFPRTRVKTRAALLSNRSEELTWTGSPPPAARRSVARASPPACAKASTWHRG